MNSSSFLAKFCMWSAEILILDFILSYSNFEVCLLAVFLTQKQETHFHSEVMEQPLFNKWNLKRKKFFGNNDSVL